MDKETQDQLLKMKCQHCKELMYGLIQVHHHTERGVDVTK